MSMAKCDFCDSIIDTDEDPESTYHVRDKFICEGCRERFEADDGEIESTGETP